MAVWCGVENSSISTERSSIGAISEYSAPHAGRVSQLFPLIFYSVKVFLAYSGFYLFRTLEYFIESACKISEAQTSCIHFAFSLLREHISVTLHR